MIKANHTGVLGCAANGFDEVLVARICVPLRVEGREAPVLPLGVKVIGWRAYPDARGEKLLVGPVVCAYPVRGKSQILIEAERAARGLDGGVSLAELLVQPHLDEGEEVDVAGLFSADLLDCRALRGLVFGGPLTPVPQIRMPSMEVAVDRGIAAVVCKPDAAMAAVLIEFTSVPAQEFPVEQKQEESLQSSDFLVGDGISRPQGADLFFEARLSQQVLSCAGSHEFRTVFDIQVE